MIKKIISAIRILTIIPVPGKDTTAIASTLPVFPFVGCIVASVLYCVFVIVGKLPEYPLLGGVILTGALFIITGGLHFDGLADVCDGFGGGKTKSRILEIFKDSRLGTFGVSALLFDIFSHILLYSWYIEHNAFVIIGVSIVLSRATQAMVLSFTKAATPGQGIASVFCQKKYRFPVVVSCLIVITGILLVVDNTMPMICIMVAVAFFVSVFVAMCFRKIDGVTGDCIGAINEIAEITVLIGGFVSGAEFSAVLNF